MTENFLGVKVIVSGKIRDARLHRNISNPDLKRHNWGRRLRPIEVRDSLPAEQQTDWHEVTTVA